MPGGDSIDRISAAAYDPRGDMLVTGAFDGRLTLWRREQGVWRRRSITQGHKYAVSALSVSNSGLVASIDDIENTIALWQPIEGKLVEKWRKSDVGISQVFAFYFNASGTALHVSGRNGGVNSNSSADPNAMVGVGGLDVSTGQPLPQHWPQPEAFIAITSDAAENLVATTATNGWVSLLDYRTGKRIARITLGGRASWVTIDEANHFDASDLTDIPSLYWGFSDDPLRLYGVDLMIRDYYEPRLIPRALACATAASCDSAFPKVRPLAELNRIQPGVRILGVRQGGSPGEALVTVEATAVEDPTQPNGKTRTDAYDLRLFRDGALVGRWPETPVGSDEITAWRQRTHLQPLTGVQAVTHDFVVKLPTGKRTDPVAFTAYAFNEDRVKSAIARGSFMVSKDGAPRRPKAYVITIGVDAYQAKQRTLRFAARDADAMRTALTALEGYEVVAVSLTSKGADQTAWQATKSNIRDALARLAGRPTPSGALAGVKGAEQLAQATPDDLVIITYSGHGYTEKNGAFYLLPSDSGPEMAITTNALGGFISSEELSEWLRPIDAGQMAMIIDACHSAASVEQPGFKPGPMGDRGLGQLAYDKAMRILAASQADDVALESARLQQGLLTYALVHDGLLRGADGKRPADLDHNGRLTLAEWLRYGEQHTPALYEDIRAGRKDAVYVGRDAVIDPALQG